MTYKIPMGRPLVITLLLLMTSLGGAEEELKRTVLKADKSKVQLWNSFVDELLQVHDKLITAHPVHTTEAYGGYYQLPKFYQQISYTDSSNNQLLSRIQRESKAPEKIHQIEVFIYASNGKLVRDYLAAYLPRYRNAPISTFINFHQYAPGLHGFRQFDASGNRIYEQCKLDDGSDEIIFSLEEADFSGAHANKTLLGSKRYQQCFGDLPLEAGQYLKPSVELSATATAERSAEQIHAENSELTAQLAKQPHNTPWLIRRADNYFELHEFAAAIEDYSRALHYDDHADAAYYGRGLARGRAGYLDAGIADLSVYIERHPRDARAYTKRGVRYLWKGDEVHAEKDLRQAIDLNPNNAEAHDDLGVILARRGNYVDAQQHFQTTLSVDPTYQKGWHNLAMALYLSHQDAPALRAVDAALKLSPQARDSSLLKVQILRVLGRTAEADTLQAEAEFLPEGNWSEHISVR
jgi:Flp pilus assembly protein TadD